MMKGNRPQPRTARLVTASSQVTGEIVKGLGDVLFTKQKLWGRMVASRCLEGNTPGRPKNFLRSVGMSDEGVSGLFVEVIKKRPDEYTLGTGGSWSGWLCLTLPMLTSPLKRGA